MATKRHLNKAPIREALVDVQFEAPLTLERLQTFVDSVRDKFRDVSTVWEQALGFEVSPGVEPRANEASSTPVGFRLSDEARVLIARRTGFTYSRLPPYEDWDELRQAGKEMWDKFVEIARPDLVNRTAVRYINLLPLPIVNEEFATYLTAAPTVPAKLPQGLASFLQRVVMVDPTGNRVAVVTQALEGPPLVEGRVQVLLDIDAIRTKTMQSTDAGVWESLDDLRHFKNDIFFEYITEPTARLFE
jgi:uncharacterized protein (TIGR04255 family)